MARNRVVDDEHNIRMMIRLALQHEGHTVEGAADGNEGLEKFGDGAEWDLVLLDQRMPGLEGVAVLRQMRYHNPRARIIMITAFGTIDLAVDAMKAGATDFLRKPFTTETLRGAVQAVLKPGSGGDTASRPSSGLTFGMTTINGFHIAFEPGKGLKLHNELGFAFEVLHPDGQTHQCTVVLTPVVIELVKAHTDLKSLPGGDRFWQALCEEALANYLYQHADVPPDNFLHVEELTAGLQRFVDAILAAG